MEDKVEYHDETNLLDYFNIVNKHKNLILLIISISLIITGIVSFLSPKIYRATAVIMHIPNKQAQRSFTSIASRFGFAPLQSSNVMEIIALLNSKILKKNVIKKYNLVPVLSEKDKKGNDKVQDPFIFKVKRNRVEGVIELSVKNKDPEMSAKILTYMLTELTDYMSSEVKRVAETNKKYLESQVDLNIDPLIKQKIYTLIARQIEISMLAEVKENFAFKVIDPPIKPVRHFKPNFIINFIAAFVISLFAGVFLALFLEYFKNLKKLQRNSDK